MQHTSPLRARGKSIWLDTIPRGLLDSVADSKLVDHRHVTDFVRALRQGQVHGSDGWVAMENSPPVASAAAASVAAGA
jgi:hypothetical protein